MPPRLIVEVLGDTSNLERSFARASRSATGFNKSLSQAGRGALSASIGFRGIGRTLAFTSAGFLGGAGFIAATKGAVSAASNLSEQMSKTNVVFGSSAGTVTDWSKTTTTAMGLAQDQALATASSFGALLRPLGLTGGAAAKTSIDLSKLGADLASFSNTPVPDALDAIRSGLIGEAEPLRRYGVLLSEVRVQQVALAQTGKKHAAELTNQEKVLARIAIIYRDTQSAQGDFARTSGGLANQQRILSANVRQLQIVLGQALIPDVLRVVKAMNEWLGKSENQERVTRDVHAAVGDLRSVVAAIVPLIQNAAGAAQAFSKAVGGAGNAVKILGGAFLALKFAKLLDGFAGISGGAKGAAGNVSVLRSRLLALRALGVIGVTVVVGFEIAKGAQALDKFLGEKFGEKFGIGSFGDFDAVIKKRNEMEKAAAGAGPNLFGGKTPLAFNKQAAALKDSLLAPLNKTLDRIQQATVTASAGAGKPGVTGTDALSKMARNALSLSGARTPAAELSALREQRELLGKAIATETQRLNNAPNAKAAAKFADNLQSLLDKDNAAFSQIQSIQEQAASAARASSSKATAAAKKLTREREKNVAAVLKAVLKALPHHVTGTGPAGMLPGFLLNRNVPNRVRGSGDNPLAQFTIPMRLQVAAAKAGTTTGMSDDLRIARQTKTLAQKALAANRLGWQGMIDAYNTIAQQNQILGDRSQVESTKFRKESVRKLLREGGVDPANVKRASFALSRVGVGGTVPGRGSGAFGQPLADADRPIVVHTHVSLDGREIARNTTKHQQTRKRRNPTQKRGPFTGGL